MDTYFSVEELVAIENDARNSLFSQAESDPTHYIGLLIDVSRAYRNLLEKRMHGE